MVFVQLLIVLFYYGAACRHFEAFGWLCWTFLLIVCGKVGNVQEVLFGVLGGVGEFCGHVWEIFWRQGLSRRWKGEIAYTYDIPTLNFLLKYFTKCLQKKNPWHFIKESNLKKNFLFQEIKNLVHKFPAFPFYKAAKIVEL